MQGELLPSDVDSLSDTLTNFRIETVDRLSSIQTMLAASQAKNDDHEARIRKLEENKETEARLTELEKFKWMVMGSGVLSIGALGTAITQLMGG